MPVPAMELLGLELSSDKQWYWVVAALLLSVSVWASISLIDSPFGRALRALHGSEVASQVVGVNVVRYRCRSSCCRRCSPASWRRHGALRRLRTPNFADFFHSIELVTMVVVGGMASVFGSIVGAVLLTALPQALATFEGWETVVFGAVLMLHDFPAQGPGAHAGSQIR